MSFQKPVRSRKWKPNRVSNYFPFKDLTGLYTIQALHHWTFLIFWVFNCKLMIYIFIGSMDRQFSLFKEVLVNCNETFYVYIYVLCENLFKIGSLTNNLLVTISNTVSHNPIYNWYEQLHAWGVYPFSVIAIGTKVILCYCYRNLTTVRKKLNDLRRITAQYIQTMWLDQDVSKKYF